MPLEFWNLGNAYVDCVPESTVKSKNCLKARRALDEVRNNNNKTVVRIVVVVKP
jgi:hypothetical protein